MMMWYPGLYTLVLPVVLASCVKLIGWMKWLWNIMRIGRKVNMLPGPKGHWLYGNLHQVPIGGEQRLQWWTSNCTKYKTAHSLWTGLLTPYVFVYHPTTIKRVLNASNHKTTSSKGVAAMLLEWLGEGLLLSSGPAWKRNRRLVTPAFHFNMLKTYTGVYNEATDILLGKFSMACDPRTNPRGSVEITAPVGLCAHNVVLRCAFSFPDDVQRVGHPFVQTIQLLANLILQRYFNPLVYLDFVYNLTSNGKKWRQGCQYSHQVAQNLMEKRKAQLKLDADSDNCPERRLDFLDILLLARDEEGEGLTDLEIRHEITTFLVAGTDTTDSAINWCLYNLACHPEYQSKAREEVDTLLEGRESDIIQWEDLQHLPYLTMCIKESLRHTPPVPTFGRQLTSALEIDGVTLEPGTYVAVEIWSVHHNPHVWGEDHMEYKPERFLFENTKNMDPHSFIPFSAGSRNCIGQNLAMNEVKTVVARVLHRFTLEVDADHTPQRQPEPTMKAKNGIYLIMKQR